MQKKMYGWHAKMYASEVYSPIPTYFHTMVDSSVKKMQG